VQVSKKNSKDSGSVWHKITVSTKFELTALLEALPHVADTLPDFKGGIPSSVADKRKLQAWLDEQIAPLCAWPMSSENLENDPPFGEECEGFDGSDSLPDFKAQLSFEPRPEDGELAIIATCTFRLPMRKRISQAYLENQFAEDHRPFAESCFFYVQNDEGDPVIEHNESDQFEVTIKPEGK
jgi:hypothetical protein